MTRQKSGTERVTTAPMPTIENRPSSMPGPITARAPMVVPARTTVASVCSSGSEVLSSFRSDVVARGKRSLVKVVPALIITPVSMLTAVQT